MLILIMIYFIDPKYNVEDYEQNYITTIEIFVLPY